MSCFVDRYIPKLPSLSNFVDIFQAWTMYFLQACLLALQAACYTPFKQWSLLLTLYTAVYNGDKKTGHLWLLKMPVIIIMALHWASWALSLPPWMRTLKKIFRAQISSVLFPSTPWKIYHDRWQNDFLVNAIFPSSTPINIDNSHSFLSRQHVCHETVKWSYHAIYYP